MPDDVARRGGRISITGVLVIPHQAATGYGFAIWSAAKGKEVTQAQSARQQALGQIAETRRELGGSGEDQELRRRRRRSPLEGHTCPGLFHSASGRTHARGLLVLGVNTDQRDSAHSPAVDGNHVAARSQVGLHFFRQGVGHGQAA